MNIIEAIKILNQDENNLIDTSLRFVRTQLNGVLVDVAKIHLLSAEQAFISATQSNEPETEARVGIGHMCAAFNAYQLHLEKGVKILWFKTDFSPEDKCRFQLKITSIAIVISLIYKRLKDENNYISWKSIGVTNAKKYLQEWRVVVEGFKYATMNVGQYGGIDDDIKRNSYEPELKFIADFSSAIKEI